MTAKRYILSALKKLWRRDEKETELSNKFPGDSLPLIISKIPQMEDEEELDEEVNINKFIKESKSPLLASLQVLQESNEKAIERNNERADKKQLAIIKEGVEVWNNWRKENPKVKVKLYGADLRGAKLMGANLNNARLDEACLIRADLRQAHLDGATLSEADLSEADLQGASIQNADLSNVRLFEADLRGANLRKVLYGDDANFQKANLVGADLRKANLSGAHFADADLSEALLIEADLNRATLYNAKLYRADLFGADLSNAFLNEANLSEANLREANLYEANFYRTDLGHANLTGADLQNAILVETNLEKAVMTGSKIYGLSAWALKGTPKDQSSLIITPNEKAAITVDDLKLGQFVYLLLNNENVRNVIETITTKSVLILGRFTPERKRVLDLIRQELNNHDYVPILFDFTNTQNQSLLETVMTLAGMSRFIIADVTNATMVREELRSIVEKFPSKPIQPIILSKEKEYVTLPEITLGFRSLLKVYVYEDQIDVVSNIKRCIINPAEIWIESRKSLISGSFKTVREIELEKENESLRKRINEIE